METQEERSLKEEKAARSQVMRSSEVLETQRGGQPLQGPGVMKACGSTWTSIWRSWEREQAASKEQVLRHPAPLSQAFPGAELQCPSTNRTEGPRGRAWS